MKIFCVGRNYAEHALELKNEVPEEPVIFLKPKSAFLSYKNPFYYPAFTNELHYEIELVLKFSKNGKYIDERHALNFISAITVGIDFTARDIQQKLKQKSLPWEKAKAWDNSAVVGDFIETNPQLLKKDIEFYLEKNGEKVQIGNSKNMLFSFSQLVADISQYFSINIGDLLFTGTPSGVGECVVGDVLAGYMNNEKLFEFTIQ